MGLKSYASLHEALKNKTRGRMHSAQVSTSPPIWAKLDSVDGIIRCYFEPRGCQRQHVATLYPDNSLEVDIHGWHTQMSCKIIEALTPNRAQLHKGVVWAGMYPVDDVLCYDCDRRLIIPSKFSAATHQIADKLGQVSLDDMPPRERLMSEVGTYKHHHAVTQNIVAYVTGRIDKSALKPRDIYTLLDGGTHARIQQRVFEEMI